MSELNFARFDAKLEQRVAELRAELERRAAELRAEMQAGFAQTDGEVQAGFARVDRRLAELETKLTKRLFGFWIAQAATTVALVLGVVKLVSA